MCLVPSVGRASSCLSASASAASASDWAVPKFKLTNHEVSFITSAESSNFISYLQELLNQHIFICILITFLIVVTPNINFSGFLYGT